MMISRAGRGSVERRDECDEEAIPWRRYVVVDGGPARPSFFLCSRARSYVKPPDPHSVRPGSALAFRTSVRPFTAISTSRSEHGDRETFNIRGRAAILGPEWYSLMGGRPLFIHGELVIENWQEI